MVDQMHVMHARGARRHAGEARQAAVDVGDDLLGRGRVALQHLLDQVDAAARRIELVAEQHIGRAGRGAEAAMHAGAQNVVGHRDVRIGELGEGEVGLHFVTVSRTRCSMQCCTADPGPFQTPNVYRSWVCSASP
jgi:hypothetical protein